MSYQPPSRASKPQLSPCRCTVSSLVCMRASPAPRARGFRGWREFDPVTTAVPCLVPAFFHFFCRSLFTRSCISYFLTTFVDLIFALSISFVLSISFSSSFFSSSSVSSFRGPSSSCSPSSAFGKGRRRRRRRQRCFLRYHRRARRRRRARGDDVGFFPADRGRRRRHFACHGVGLLLLLLLPAGGLLHSNGSRRRRSARHHPHQRSVSKRCVFPSHRWMCTSRALCVL